MTDSTVSTLLKSYHYEHVDRVCKIIDAVGFKNEVNEEAEKVTGSDDLLLGIVQDADRLDAMGAIGIARCFTYGGHTHRPIYNDDVPRTNMSKEDYCSNKKTSSINHFHEKLLKLKGLMKTRAGRNKAQCRHQFLLDFVSAFDDERKQIK